MKKWFLYRVFKVNKRLFVVLMLFLAGTFFTNLLGWQVTPFIVWGMYSEKEDSSRNHPLLKVTVNDNTVINYTRYTDANKFFLVSPAQLYILMKNNNREDPTAFFLKRKLGNNYFKIKKVSAKVLNGSDEYNLLLPWYKRYLEQTTSNIIHSYTIELLNAGFTDKNKIEIYSTQLIDSWKQ